MDNDNKSGTGALPAGYLWIALLVVGAFTLHEVPWQPSRPSTAEPKVYGFAAPQDVDARLWQDPLSAVRRSIDGDEAPKPAAPPSPDRPEPDVHDPIRLGKDIAKAADAAGSPVLIAGVMVAGGGYADSVEFRRRARYAALAAFSATGLAPADSEHLGYVLPRSGADGVPLP